MSGGTLGELVEVSVTKHAEGVRLRWRKAGKRPELYIASSTPNHSLVADRLKKVIEDDCIRGNYDPTLTRYRQMLKYSLIPEIALPSQMTDLVTEFDNYLAAKAIPSDAIPTYYEYTRKVLIKWGKIDLNTIPKLLSMQNYSARTFNDRRNCLSNFFKYLVRKKKIPDNPLEDVDNRTPEDYIETRVPFTNDEVSRILYALKTNQFRKGRYSHAVYYPLVAFMVQTGVRNGEAIALQVRDILWDQKDIKICRSMARTKKGTHISARKEKGTKNRNIRLIPMNEFLISLITPLVKDKQATELVFLNDNGNMIDDRAFQRRVFKPLLQKLSITERDLYACRHTFATRAVQAGMRPHEVAYLMGDRLDTIIKNYYHNEQIRTTIPEMIKISV